MLDGRPKVLYVAGTIHGGSTIFGNVLSQAEEFFHAGELVHIWRGLRQGTLCGCGVRYKDCEVWRAVFAQAYGGFDRVDPARMDGLVRQLARRGGLRGAVLAGERAAAPQLSEFASVTSGLYQAIQSVSGCKVVVDTSKAIWYGHLLRTQAPLALHTVHLVRDPRGVSYSLYRKYKGRRQPDTAWARARYAARTARAWVLFHLAAEFLRPKAGVRGGYMRLRYEDFVDQPTASVRRVADFVGEQPGSLDFIQGRNVNIRATHTVEGNRVRHRRGSVELRLDAEWVAQMRATSKALVTALTLPVLLRYNYPVIPARERQS